ncbi:ficolin-2-like [Ciona intestinalis]
MEPRQMSAMQVILIILLYLISHDIQFANGSKEHWLAHGGNSRENWCHSTKNTKMMNVAYRMCLTEAPIFVNASVKPTDSSLPHKFNITVKQIERYSFLSELTRTDQISGWENISLTVVWTTYMKSDASSCEKLYEFGHRKNRLYNIYLNRTTKLEVYCDMENNGGGWTVIQRNMDNRTNFDREWFDYKTGFGNKTGSFWIGLENIRALTKKGDQELRIDITTCNKTKIVAEYSNFMVGPESERYKLWICGYQHRQECCFSNNGSSDSPNNQRCDGDALGWNNGNEFSAKDFNSKNRCTDSRKAGWWFSRCTGANLNGNYKPCTIGPQYAYWRKPGSGSPWEGVRFIEMKIRQTN